MFKWHILFFPIVGTQAAIIAFLGFGVFQDVRLLADVSVNVIDADSITFAGEDSAYAHFYELKPNEVMRVSSVSCCPRLEWLEGEVVYTINSEGFNDRYEYSVEKPAGVFRIVSLGDSYTYGSNVSTEKTYSELLEDKLNEELSCDTVTKFEVLNLGVGGYDLAYAAERFRLRGQKYDPDLVIWSVKSGNFVNNITELQIEQFDKGKEKVQREGRKLAAKEIIWLNEEAVREAQNIVRSLGKEWMSSYVKDVLRKLSEYYAGKLVLFSASSWPWDEDSLFLVEEFARSRPGTSFYRMTSDLSEGGLLPDYHPSEKGHEIMASELLSYLVKEHAVPCKILR